MVIRRRNAFRRSRRNFIRRTGRSLRRISKRTIRGKVRLAQGKIRTSRRYRNILRMVGTIAQKKFVPQAGTLAWPAPGWRQMPLTWPTMGAGDFFRRGQQIFARYMLMNWEFYRTTFGLNTYPITADEFRVLPARIRIMVVQPKGQGFSSADLPPSYLEMPHPDSYFVIYDKSFYLNPTLLVGNTTNPTWVLSENTRVYRKIKIPMFKTYDFEEGGDTVPTAHYPQVWVFSPISEARGSFYTRLYFTDN